MKLGRPVIHTKETILTSALELANEIGYTQITREKLARRSGVSDGQISQLFGTMIKLRRAIVSAAIARNDLTVIAQGVVANEPKALACSPDVKRAALEYLIK